MKQNEVNVLTEEKIVQKMAGYKSAFTKMVQNGEADESDREAWLAERENRIRKENKHNKMVRAGFASWETRRANSKKRRVTSTSTKTSKNDSKTTKTTKTTRKSHSKVGVRIIKK